jgi:hypothetical protein
MGLLAPVLKKSWPEVKGMPATPAVKHIMTDRPDVAVEVLPLGTGVTHDYDDKRVRVFINKHGIVSLIPIIG